MSERSEELDTGFSAIFQSLLKNIHTAMPGKVVSFDKTNQTISVQPVLKRLYADSDDSENLPIIEDVPVSFPGSGDFWLTFDIKKDSYVLLIFSERSIAKWLVKGGIVDPEQNRTFDLSDAIAIAGINPFPDFIPNGFPTDGFSLTNRTGTTYFEIIDGKIVLNSLLVELAESGATDFAVAYTDLKTAFDQLKQDLNTLINLYNFHVHSGVTTGPGSTGTTPSVGTPSSADMTAAKVDKVKVP